MDEIKKITKSKELIVRKRVSSFLEKTCRFMGYDFNHGKYKKIVYNEEPCYSDLECKLKNYYDGIMFLLNNSSMTITRELIDKFFYIIGYKKNNSYLCLKIASEYFNLINLPIIEKCVDFHLFVYKELSDEKETDSLLISLIFLNYCLNKEKIPCIHILNKDLIKYVKLRELYFNNDKNKMYEFMMELIKKAKFQDKSYYKNLKELTAKDIKIKMLNDKKIINEKFKIKHLYLYGSFCFNQQRIDSDIDFIVRFEETITQGEKVSLCEKFKEYYFEVFQRYVDFYEISEYLTDDMLKEFNKAEKIF